MLRALAAHDSKIVSKRALIDRCWESDQGSEQKLAKAISDLRRILRRHGTDAIESVYGRGYRLIPRDESNARQHLRDKVQALCAEAGYRVYERDPASLDMASQLFIRALEMEPRCRDAHLGLAEIQIHGIQLGYWRSTPAWRLARTHLEEARRIDPDCLMLYLLLSLGLSQIEDDLVAAAELESEIRRCNRGSPVGHPVPSYLHLSGGFPDRAVADIDVALDRDPASIPASAFRPYALMCARRHGDALRAIGESLAVGPSNPVLQAMCGWVEATLGKPRDAVSLTSKALESRPTSVGFAAIHAYALSRIGENAAATRLLERCGDPGDEKSPVTSMSAIAWLALEDRARAIESLKDAVKARCFWRRIVYHDPRFDPLRDDPEVHALFAKGPQ